MVAGAPAPKNLKKNNACLKKLQHFFGADQVIEKTGQIIQYIYIQK